MEGGNRELDPAGHHGLRRRDRGHILCFGPAQGPLSEDRARLRVSSTWRQRFPQAHRGRAIPWEAGSESDDREGQGEPGQLPYSPPRHPNLKFWDTMGQINSTPLGPAP